MRNLTSPIIDLLGDRAIEQPPQVLVEAPTVQFGQMFAATSGQFDSQFDDDDDSNPFDIATGMNQYDTENEESEAYSVEEFNETVMWKWKSPT